MYPTKPLTDITRGDILLTRILYEENTSDYYSGHNPYDVISRARTDHNGNNSKIRPVVVLDNINGELFVAPLTTKHDSEHDDEHQMELKHTENLPGDTRSFVEVSNVRRIHSRDRPIPYITKIDPSDMSNLVERYETRILSDYHFREQKHTHVFVPDKKTYENKLKGDGYTQTDNIWSKGKHSVEFKGDMVTSKVDLSLEEVLQKQYPRSHFTMNSGADRKPCSPQIDLLVDDVRSQIKPNLQFYSTNHIPRGLDAITRIGRTTLQIKAATDHGAVSELGTILLAKHKMDFDKLPEFVTWYETEYGLDVVDPVPVKTDFSCLNLSPSLVPDDLFMNTISEIQQ